jgi:protein ImuA
MSTAILSQLANQIRALETANRSQPGKSLAISTGCPALDARLPQGGYEPGTIVEWLEPTHGCGGFYLAMAAARQAVGHGSTVHGLAGINSKYWVVVDRKQRFYPPAAQAMGLPLDRLIVLRPTNQADEMWAIDQALRCSAIGAVIAELEEVNELQARRFQLAAEQGESLGLWLRPASVRKQPSWSEIQWLIEPWLLPARGDDAYRKGQNVRRIGIQSLRMRGGKSGQRWTLALDLRTGQIALEEPCALSSHLHLASQLAMSASTRHPANRTRPATVRPTGT